MKRDLRIRELGRPKISKDSQIGYNQIVRRYVVEGDKVSLSGILGSDGTMFEGVPLFEAVGTPDTEFNDYYLVNQAVEPSGTTVDKAYLSRTYAEIRNTWNTESVSEDKNLTKVSRTYVVLKAEHERGYSSTNFAKHPSVKTYGIEENAELAWDFLPETILNTEPGTILLEDFAGAANSHPSSLRSPRIGNQNIQGAIMNGGIVNKYLRHSVKIDHTNPGVDIWTCSWAAPGKAHWVTQSTSSSTSGFRLPTIVSFSSNGVEVHNLGSVPGSSTVVQAYQFVFYHVGEELPEQFITYMGGSGGGVSMPSVAFDVAFQMYGGGTKTIQRVIPNAIWKDMGNNANIVFPGSEEQIAKGGNGTFIFNYTYGSKTPKIKNCPHYQNAPIIRAGGRIDYTAAYMPSGSSSSRVSTTIIPVHTHRGEKIWKVAITYA
jgi:hypothetical protein